MVQNLKTLETLYTKACEAYYDGNPVMTDAEFDLLQEQIKTLSPGNPVLKGVGATAQVTVWPVVKHQILMGSTFKVNSLPELMNWCAKYTKNQEVCWSEKLDGSSIELVYENGVFIRAVTRGNGEEGEDITPNAMLMQFPKTIACMLPITVRGEILLMVEDLAKYFPGECNPRNSAAGTSRRKHDNEKCKHLQVFVYDYSCPDVVAESTKKDKFEYLERLGFTVPMWGVINGGCQLAKILVDKYESIKSSLGYWIDGLIFEENDLEFFKSQGVTDNRPKAMRAYKFEDERAKTQVIDIVRQTGKTGVIVPVALIKPTLLGGSTISRVSLMNFAEIRKLGVTIGSSATIIKCNQIIPRIIGVDERAEYIPDSTCPSCGSETIWDGEDILDGKPIRQVCPNKDCPAQVTSRILGYLSAIDIKGFGDKLVEKLADAGKLEVYADIYRLTPADFAALEGCGEKVGIKICTQIQNKRVLDLPTFIKAINLKGFASSFTKLVMEKITTLELMRAAKLEDLGGIKGIGSSIAESMVNGLKENAQNIDDLLKFVTIDYPKPVEEVVGGTCSGKSFVFTGVRSKEGEARIIQNGGKVLSGVSKNATHLVCKDKSASSEKLKKAAELGLIIMSLEEFEANFK